MTDTPTPTDSPIYKLLTELVTRDDARQEKLDQLSREIAEIRREAGEERAEREATMVELRSMLRDTKSSQVRQEVMEREVRNELQRQDHQLQGFDRRISGNYMGISAQLDVLNEELREQQTSIGNMERAVVESSRDQKIMHGRFIELSGDTRERLGVLERTVPELDKRVQRIEGARVSSEEISVGEVSAGILGAAGGGGG